jgi:hypothetical protein
MDYATTASYQILLKLSLISHDLTLCSLDARYLNSYLGRLMSQFQQKQEEFLGDLPI